MNWTTRRREEEEEEEEDEERIMKLKIIFQKSIDVCDSIERTMKKILEKNESKLPN